MTALMIVIEAMEASILSPAEPAENKNILFKIDFLTDLSLASFLWDIGKQHSPRCDAADWGVPSGAILFAQRNFNEK